MDPDQVAHWLELEDRLSKIRSQIQSKLDNQKHIAIILSAVEENIDTTQEMSKNIVQYLLTLMTLLDQGMDKETHMIKDLKLTTSTTYILDIIFHYCPKTLLRKQFADILTKIAPCITDEKAEAPLIKSAIGCLEALLIAQDAQAWNNTYDLSITPRRGLQGLLELSTDPRPKVRKRALDSVSNILSNPPPAPTPQHVAAGTIVDYSLSSLISILQELSNTSNKKLKVKGTMEEFSSRIIRALRLINAVIMTGQWPSNKIEPLCDSLLEVTKSSEQYLVSTAFECFENLFKSMAESTITSGLAENKFLKVLDIIFSLKPSNNDTHLTGSWIAVVVKAMSTYAMHQPLKCFQKIPEVFRLMSFYMASETPEIYLSASNCLMALISDSIKDDQLLYPPAVSSEHDQAVAKVIKELALIMVDFLSIKFIHCAKETLNILAALFNKLRYRSNPYFISALQLVDKWRVNEENYLEIRNEAENVIGAAISSMGPDVVLSLMPLNLENPSDDEPGRAWLIPIIRDYTKNSKLSVFSQELAPLIKFFESKFDMLPQESVQLRVFQTIVDQLWSTLPHFCELPMDLQESFNDEFASEISSLLYSNINLRTTLCHALRMLVESNSLYANGALSDDILLQQHFSIEESKQNVDYLASKSSNILAVLFNVYTETAPNSRGYIMETIEAYLKITKKDDLEKTFNNVCSLLKDAIEKENNKQEKSKPQVTATLLDFIVCMTKYLPESSYTALFSIFGITINSKNTLIQKRAYRIITKLTELETGSNAVLKYINDIETIILDNSNTVQTASKSARLAAIKTIIDLLPLTDLHFIVKIVPEVILSTKDVNEKSRESAFDTLLTMARKMALPGGLIKLSEIDGYGADTPEQQSSISEFFRIISAGLIGESQHMVSATITAYAFLVYEFKDDIDTHTLTEIYDTIELYLTSNSREIVKSAIGFAKVCVLGLPEEMMRPKIPELLPKLLRWSNEHAGHFKSKVKHIIERLIRRFGYDYIEEHFPENDRRLLTNIRKIRNRSQRKDVPDANTVPTSSKSSNFMNAFDEAIYGSDAEDSAAEEEPTNNRKNAHRKQFIVESNDNPLDLLDSEILAHVSSTKPKSLKKDGSKKHLISDDAFSFDDEGKLVVKQSGKQASTNDDDPLQSVTSGINAYLEAVKSGPVRGQRNKLKFKKKGGDDMDDDDEIDRNLPKSRPLGKSGKIGKKGGKFRNKRKF
ncbi:Ribosomal RNA-processing protein 12 [Nakaseomyces bracarensis]|uniref:Ribosomal RNA-processing protein 12 n=1 Tax=Nakaseomyces bracarensis TaxID=273131 RepID=A0ABR4NY29_9SACH